MSTMAHRNLGARIKPIHASSGQLRFALEALPAWRTARAALDQLDALEAPTADGDASTRGGPDQQMQAAIAAALSAGSAGADDLLIAAREITTRHASVELLQRGLIRHRETLVAELDAAVSTGADDMFTHLGGQLNELLTEATDVYAELGSVRDADAAIRAGKADLYPRLGDLRQQYAAIRDAQRQVWAISETMGRTLRSLPTAFLRKPDAVDSEFVERTAGAQVREPYGDQGWRMRDAAPAPWPDLAAPHALDWLITNPESEPWVPTRPAHDEAQERLATLVRDFLDEQRSQTVKAGRR